MDIIEIVILILGTLLLICLTWIISVKEKRYHGISRFFSFESIFLLVLLNYPNWFKDPLSLIQIISWTLLFSSIICAFWGFHDLYKKGKPEGQMENTTFLIRTGVYRYIRHPMYLSLLLGGVGAFLKEVETIQIILVLINCISLLLTAKIEENEMIKKFGEEYENYRKNSWMFIPLVF